jgi:NAD(P)-dependent dehydrogenase (short-subunit alcohol dehydrogenase family)
MIRRTTMRSLSMSGATGRTFDATSTALEVVGGLDLGGRRALVTGGVSGLGFEVARALAAAGADVVIAGRDPDAGHKAAEELNAGPGSEGSRSGTADGSAGRVIFEQLDLSSLASVRGLVDAYLSTGWPLHLLVNNAGIMATPFARTEDGFESQFGINHLGHFALAVGLLPTLETAGGARVVSVSSSAHRRADVDFDDPNFERRAYEPWEAYGQSKSANGLFAVELSRRWADRGVLANSVTPGAAMTGLQRHMSRADLVARGWRNEDGSTPRLDGWKTAEQGAASLVWAAVAPDLDGVGGKYVNDCALAQPWTGAGGPPGFGYYLPRLVDPERARRLWMLSEQLVGPR